MRLKGGRTGKRAVVCDGPRADRADEAVRPRGLVRRAGRRARLERLRQVPLPAAARRRRQRPRQGARAGGGGADQARRPHRQGQARRPRAARAGSCRPTSTPSCAAARCWRSCTAATSTATAWAARRPPGCWTATSSAHASEQKFESLSGGQQARFQILLLELSGATLLLLDEPTDNLDVQSAEALEAGLESFEGTVVAVTHDRWFARGFDRFLVFGASGDVYESDEPVWDERPGPAGPLTRR